MEELIVSPFLIYLIGLSEKLEILSVVVLVFLIAITTVCSIIAKADRDFHPLNDTGWYFKMLKWFVPIFLIFLTFFIFVPNKSTLIQMIVTSELTYERLDKVIDSGRDIKDEIKNDIIDIINSLDETKPKENK